MAAVGAIGSLLYAGYNAIASNQQSQKAKGEAGTLLDKAKKMTATETAASSVAAARGANLASVRAKAASGADATILTGPQGAAAAPVVRKTLLGI